MIDNSKLYQRFNGNGETVFAEAPPGWEDPGVHITKADALMHWVLSELSNLAPTVDVTPELNAKTQQFFDRCMTNYSIDKLIASSFVRDEMARPNDARTEVCSWAIIDLVKQLRVFRRERNEGRSVSRCEILYLIALRYGQYISVPIDLFEQCGELMVCNDFRVMQSLPPHVCVTVLLTNEFEETELFRRLKSHWIAAL